MRVLLLNPPYYLRGRPYLREHPGALMAAPALGLASIKAQLLREGHEARIMDFSLDTWEEVDAALACLDPLPDVAGVMVMTTQHRQAYALVDRLARLRPRPVIVCGGPHATVLDVQAVTQHPAVDFVLRGEGEYALGELLGVLSKGGDVGSVQGLTCRRGGEVLRTPPRPLIRDLDSLPVPDYADYDLERFRKYSLPASFFPDRRRAKHRRTRPVRIHVAASRGCPARCHFCFSLWGKNWHPRAPQAVLREIRTLYDRHHFGHLQFVDDTFNADPERVKAICQGILDSGMAFTWECGARVDVADREMFRLMRESGCIRCAFGVPSTDDALLSSLNKGAVSRQIRLAFRLAEEAGLWADATVLVGNLGETTETLRRTAAALSRSRIKGLSVQRIVVFPATVLYRRMVNSGLLDDGYWLQHDRPPLYTETFSEEELMEQMALLKALVLPRIGQRVQGLAQAALYGATALSRRAGVRRKDVARCLCAFEALRGRLGV